MSSQPIVYVENVIKIYTHRLDNSKISALQGCDLIINQGEIVSIIGPSGAGKSTLLRILAGVDKPSSGIIQIGSVEIQNWHETRSREFRRKYIGTFSQHARENFDPKMKVVDAIKWELLNASWSTIEAEKRTHEVLDKLNISSLRNNKCGSLSAGEAMRVSLGKAIAKKPYVILADEPTGQLDSENMQILYELMKEAAKEGTAIIVATHDIRFQTLSDRSLLMISGKLATQEESLELLSQHQTLHVSALPEHLIRNVILDSNNGIRIPSSVITDLGVEHRLVLEYQKHAEQIILSRHPEDQKLNLHIDEAIPRPDFSRQKVASDIMIKCINLSKKYETSAPFVINKLGLGINKGEFTVLLGPSGIGKTTLLSMISGLETITSGELTIADTTINKADAQIPSSLRLNDISYLTQNYILHPHLTVNDNILLTGIFKKKPIAEYTKAMNRLLLDLGISMFSLAYPTELSGGQRQRVALATALLKHTDILLADEPTANLDSRLARVVMNLLTQQAEEGKTVVIATHDLMLIRPGYRVLRMDEKGIYEDVIADEKYCEQLTSEYLNSE